MEDLDGNVRFAADSDRFSECRYFRFALAAHVRGVESAVLRSNLGQLDQFLCLGVTVRGINEGTGDAQRPVFHGLLDQSFHPLHLIKRWSTIVIANYRLANFRRTDIRAYVDGCAVLFEPVKVAV